MVRFRLLVLLFLGAGVAVLPSHAGLIFQFDELGDFSYSLNNGVSYTPLTSGVSEIDPTGGISVSDPTMGYALVYNLTTMLSGFDLVDGDVPVGGTGGGIIADLRFTGDPNGNVACGTVQCLMIYYVFDNNGLPADVGNIPTTFLTTQTPGTTLVSGQFSYSDFRYTAGVLMYDGTVVPEPGTAAMALAGLGALAFIRSRSKAR